MTRKSKILTYFLAIFLPYSSFACAGSPSLFERLPLPLFFIGVIFLLLSFFIKRKNEKISKLFIILFSLLTAISLGISYMGVATFFLLWFFSLPIILILFLLYITSKSYKGKNQTIHNICFSLFIILGLIVLYFMIAASSSMLGCSNTTF